eukprot:2757882-Amphidinium_carterae.1
MGSVMTMLSEAEGEKEKELFDKYMCYCKTSSGTLQDTSTHKHGADKRENSCLASPSPAP